MGIKIHYFYDIRTNVIFNFQRNISIIGMLLTTQGSMRLQIGRIRNLRVIALCFLALIVIPHSYHCAIGPQASTNNLRTNLTDLEDSYDIVPVNEEPDLLNDDEIWSISADSPPIVEGIIDPVQIEQRGYSTTNNISTRTDTYVNMQQDLDLDVAHDWVASQVDVSIWNLQQLYVLNGTYDYGLSGINLQPNGTVDSYPYGWTSNSSDTSTYDDDVQLSIYDDAERTYVAIENQGGKVGQNEFGHAAGTRIVWSQTVTNLPHSEDFLLNFNYFYLRGPLDLNPSDPISGNCSIHIYVDGFSVWNMSLLTLSERGVWTDIGQIPLSLPGAPASFLFEIGLEIDELLVLDKRSDYDNNGLEDGSLFTQYITVYLDDVTLIASFPPDCDVVGLEFLIDGLATEIVGTGGSGVGTLTNIDYWESSSLNFAIHSNTSVSLDYHIRLLNHRFINTSWITDISSAGVHYSVIAGESIELDSYTYLGILGVYDNFTIRIYPISDWENVTIRDPFLSDVTSSCVSTDEYVEIPTSLLDVLGWWEIEYQSPNYAFEAETQRYDLDTTNWVQDTEYHTNDSIRLSATIRAGAHLPLLSDAVNFTWGFPNCTIWYESSIVSGLVGSVISSSATFGASNTTAGQWCISYFWTNGTEISYGYVEFALHHQASIEVVFEDDLSTVVGQPVTIVVKFYDIENEMLILNEGASISSTWAGDPVDFKVNLVMNWWQADFDTTSVGAGNFEVIVNSSAPFFETTPVIITIKSEYLTELDSPGGPLEPLIYGRSYSFNFFYSKSLDGLGIDGAMVEISGNGSEWASVVNNGNGHYNLTLIPLGERDYNIRILFSEIGYENQSFVLSFLVDKVPIRVVLISSLSAREYQPIEVEVEVLEVGTDIPVLDATVTLSVTWGLGNRYALESMDEQDNGHYSVNISMPQASSEITYRVNIQVSKDNCALVQDFRETLVPLVDTDAQLFRAFILYSQPIAIGASVLVAAVIGQRMYSRKNKRKRAAAKEIKIRFHDANNILGAIVLHKQSGVPVYSKIVKGGFEETMLSAFISAIMHFRSEFDTVEESGEYQILPISDIIRAIPTPNLICAFFTLSSASKEQETKMIAFTRAVGMTLDETLAECPTKVIDAKIVKTLEWLFDDFADGILLRMYQIGEKELSGRFKRLEKSLPEVKTDDRFYLDKMIQALENSGLSEDDAYLLTMDAIEQEIILPIYSFNDIIDSETVES